MADSHLRTKLGVDHPINQHPSCDRYAEMTHVLNHITVATKSESKYLNIDQYVDW